MKAQTTPSMTAERTGERTAPHGRVGADAFVEGPRTRRALGRYVLVGRLGEGGMGVVYAAYDPELDRKVAVKVLRPTLRCTEDEEAQRARFAREAQAMAQLTHPHVVPIFDVGMVADEVFFAMEHVDGGTLRQWASAGSRSWRARVQAYLQAGAGLAAAHARGVVHGDFKPDNVLMRRDGHVLVADFGLARSEESAPVEGLGPGTLTYMAPEQLEGFAATARSDQFSFCVALHEALCGQRPFAGRTRAELLAAMAQGGTLRLPPSMPRALRAILARGLRLRPEERYPSMDDLLRDLAGTTPRWRPRVVAIASAGAVLVALMAGWTQRTRPCEGAAAALAAVWSAPRRGALEHAFVATGRPYAEEAFRGAAARLDAYGASWSRMHTEACEATRVRGEQSEALLDLRMRCLRQHLGAVDALVGALSTAEASAVEGAMAAVEALPPLALCEDGGSLTATLPVPTHPSRRRVIDAGFEALAAAGAMQYAGRLAAARDLAGAVASSPEARDYAPLRAKAALRLGAILDALSDPAAAEDALRTAAVAGLEGRDDEAVALAWTELVFVVGVSKGEGSRAEAIVPEARAMLRRLGDRPALLEVLDHHEGVLRKHLGQYDAALALYDRALQEDVATHGEPSTRHLALLTGIVDVLRLQGALDNARERAAEVLTLATRMHGPEHPRVAAALHELGVVEYDRGDYESAQEHLTRALVLRERLFGPAHTDVALSLQAVGVLHSTVGNTTVALEELQRALALMEKARGPLHFSVGNVLSSLGGVYDALGRNEEALAVNRRALAALEASHGPDHVEVAMTLVNIGISLKRMGHPADAVPLYARSLAIFERRLGSTSPQIAALEVNYGELLRSMGRLAGAEAHHDHALRIAEATLPPSHPVFGHSLTGLGQVRLAQGRMREARAFLERALLLRTGTSAPQDLGETRFALARTLAALPGGGNEARRLALEARRSYEEVAAGHGSELAAVNAFIRAQGP